MEVESSSMGLHVQTAGRGDGLWWCLCHQISSAIHAPPHVFPFYALRSDIPPPHVLQLCACELPYLSGEDGLRQAVETERGEGSACLVTDVETDKGSCNRGLVAKTCKLGKGSIRKTLNARAG